MKLKPSQRYMKLKPSQREGESERTSLLSLRQMATTAPKPGPEPAPAEEGEAAAGGADGEFDQVAHVVEQISSRSRRFQYMAAAICGLANAADAVEVLILGFVLGNIPDVTTHDEGVLSATVFLGMLVGGLGAGFLGDRLGRKPTLVASLCVNSCFGALSGALPYWQWLAACRVIAGVGVGGSVPTLFTLFVEYLPVRDRGYFISLVALWWMVGTIIAAGTGWVMVGVYSLSWRLVVLASALPAASAGLLTALLLPESPRYSFLHGRNRDAVASLQYMARWNRATEVPISSLLLGGRPARHVVPLGSRAEEEGGAPTIYAASGGSSSSSAPSATAETDALVSDRPASVQHLSIREALGAFFGPELARTSWLLIVVWFSLSFGYYGMNVWLPALFADTGLKLDPYQDAFIVAASNLPGNIFVMLLLDRVGRKFMLSCSLLASCIAAVAFAFATSEVAVVAAACIINAISVGSWNSLDALSVEMFPTRLRTTSAGILAAFGRLGSIAGQLTFGALVEISIPALLVMVAAFLLLGAVAGWLLPRESSGVGIVETSRGSPRGGGSTAGSA